MKLPVTNCSGRSVLQEVSASDAFVSIPNHLGVVTPKRNRSRGGDCGRDTGVLSGMPSTFGVEGGVRRGGNTKNRGGFRAGSGRSLSEHPRNVVKQVRWTDEEWKQINDAAAGRGQTPCEFIRRSAMMRVELQQSSYHEGSGAKK